MKRRALVTGGSRGIGRAIAERLAVDHVVLTPTRAELDLASNTSIDEFVRGHGDIDVLVNDAAMNDPVTIDALPLELFERTLQVNLTASLRLMQAASTSMRAKSWGRIVNVSSVYAARARAGRAAYSASKAALEAVTRTAAIELAPHGILVNAIAPGFVDTELTRKNNSPETIAQLVARVPIGRLAAPAEIAEVVAFLCSDRNSYLTGQTLVVDGAFSIA